MRAFAILLGIFAQCIFFLGILQLYYAWTIVPFSFFYWLIVLILFLRLKTSPIKKLFTDTLINVNTHHLTFPEYSTIFLLFILVLLNLGGALTPELGFDALWYHLTLPKLYFIHHGIWHIPGGLLYYSDMPKLGEMLFEAVASYGSAIPAKLIQFSCGILILFVIYALSRKFLIRSHSLLVCLLFYSNLVVDWESTTAYVDLLRAFYEIVGLQAFFLWYGSQKKVDLVILGLLIGFAIETKLIAVGTLFLFIAMLFFFKKSTESFMRYMQNAMILLCSALIVPLPWFLFSYVHTGNPVYPFFTSIYPTTIPLSILNPIKGIIDIFQILTISPDPISPVYIISLPLIIITWKFLSKEERVVITYMFLGLCIWYVTPRTGGGRFLLPYLPGFSVAVGIILAVISKQYQTNKMIVTKIIIFCIYFIAITSIFYRGATEAKALPELTGFQSQHAFLSQNLNFSFGDFYDTDNYFKTHIKTTDTVLLYGFHNLYYVDFPFVDSSWLQSEEKYTYIAIQNGDLPSHVRNTLKLMYANTTTHVKLYASRR